MCNCCRRYQTHHHSNTFPLGGRGACCSPCSPMTPLPSHSTTPSLHYHHNNHHSRCCNWYHRAYSGIFSCSGVRPASCCSHQSQCCNAPLVSCNNSGHLLTCSTPAILCNGHAISPCGDGHCGFQCNGQVSSPLLHGGGSGGRCNSRSNNTANSATHCSSHTNTLCGNLNCTSKIQPNNARCTDTSLCECSQRGGEQDPMLSTPGSPPPPALLDQRSEHKVSLFSII